MHRNIRGLLILFVFLFSPVLYGQTEETLSLSLQDCILKTVEKNLGLAVEKITPQIAGISVSLANEKFLPLFAMNYSKQDSNSASFSFLDASDKVSTLSDNYSTQLSQILPTGGTLALSLNGYKTDTSRSFQTINPRYGSTLRLTFSQPLLKDFGFKMTNREIILARNNSDISDENFRRALEETIYRAKNAYWNLFYSLENLKVRQQSLKLAQELLEKNRAEIDAGTLPPIEILTAQADVATREADILEAEAMVKNSEDLLKTIINLEADDPNADFVRIVPTDSPSVIRQALSLEQSLSLAMDNRPDLQTTRIDKKTREFNLRYAKNQLYPDLSLEAGYWSPGVSGDQILYEGGNALTGNIVGIVPGGGSRCPQRFLRFQIQKLVCRPHPFLPDQQFSLPGVGCPGQAQPRTDQFETQRPGTADFPGSENSCPGRPDQLSAGGSLFSRPGTGPEKTGGRGGKIQGRLEH